MDDTEIEVFVDALIEEMVEDEIDVEDISKIGIRVFEKAEDEIDLRKREGEFNLQDWEPKGEH